MYAARARAGLVPATRREVFERFNHLKTPKCPFVNLPESTLRRQLPKLEAVCGKAARTALYRGAHSDIRPRSLSPLRCEPLAIERERLAPNDHTHRLLVELLLSCELPDPAGVVQLIKVVAGADSDRRRIAVKLLPTAQRRSGVLPDLAGVVQLVEIVAGSSD
jgi:hypothetical protein